MKHERLFADKQHPIFVLGILQRSGTNYLNNLLLLHPDVQPPGLVWEDFFLAHSDLLRDYTESVQRRWPPEVTRDVSNELGQNALFRELGNGLLSFMEAQYRDRLAKGVFPMPAQTPVKLVAATPSVRNLHLFFDLFPNAAPIIIVRDGRAVVESGVRSFNWDYGEAMRMWANGAQVILDFCRNPKHDGKFLVVRYEDLYTRTEEQMRRVLDFLGLPSDTYDFHAADHLDIMGSSELVQTRGSVHWKAVDKSPNFNPLARATDWSSNLKSRFKWIAGKQMLELGYSVDDVADKQSWNRFMDRIYGAGTKVNHRSRVASALIQAWRYRMLQVPKQNRTRSN